jgi:hypothetical protein
MPHQRGFGGQSPAITVEKIPAQAIPPPVTPVVGKPVSGLQQVRLIHNMIVEGENGKCMLVPRGEVVPLETVPERWRTSEFIEALDEYKRGKVMLQHDLICCVPNFDGERTVWREKLFSAYSLVDLATIPNRIVEGLVEGEDYLSEWDEDDRKLKEHERHNAVEEFSMDGPEIPEGYAENVHLPYGSL